MARAAVLAVLPVIALATARVAAVPPPEQVAANCEAPTYASDTLVCDDPVLRSLDARMREAWAAVDLETVVAPGAWVETQGARFRRRSLCAPLKRVPWSSRTSLRTCLRQRLPRSLTACGRHSCASRSMRP